MLRIRRIFIEFAAIVSGSTIILDELLGRKKNVILPDTIINIDV